MPQKHIDWLRSVGPGLGLAIEIESVARKPVGPKDRSGRAVPT
jgi:hypothetical protein